MQVALQLAIVEPPPTRRRCAAAVGRSGTRRERPAARCSSGIRRLSSTSLHAGREAARPAASSARTRASSSTSPSVARAAASDSALPASVPPTPPVSSRSASAARIALGQLAAQAVGADRDAAGDRLAERQDVGVKPRAAVQPPGAGADGVRLVDDQQRAGVARELAQAVVEAGVGQHDADVGQRRLGQHARDVARRQPASSASRSLNSTTAVVSRRVAPAARHCPAAGDGTPVASSEIERLVDGAVVAVVEHQHLRPAGELPRAIRSAQRLASVAVSENCQRGQPEAARSARSPTQAASAVGSIVVMPPAACALDRARRRRRRVPGHGAGVAEAEVDVGVAVDVGDARRPWPRSKNSGKPPAHIVIQLIGTPPNSVCEVSA